MPVRLLALLLSCTPALPGQASSSAEQPVERLIEDLADPLRAAAAAELLEQVGASAVPALARLIVVPQRYVEPRPRVLSAIYVLGRLGAQALPAIAALEDAALARDEAVAAQAAWALGEVGVHAAAEERDRLAARLDGLLRARFAAQVARERLLLGPAPALGTISAALAAGEAEPVIAACRVLRPPLPEALCNEPVRQQWRQLVHARLAAALQPVAMPWDPAPLRFAVGDLASAWLGLGGTEADLVVGRGLLQHFDPLLRRRGLLLVAAAPEPAFEVRAEVLPLLFDAEAELRQVAASACGRWRRQGLLALAPLRQLGRDDGDVGVRMACSSAADEVARSVAAAGAEAWVAAVDDRLQGRDPAPLPMPSAAAGLELLGELLRGAEWCGAGTLALLLPQPAAGRPAPAALLPAVLRLCANRDPALGAQAAGWLARHGRGAGLRAPDATLFRAAALLGPTDGCLAEALAWLLAGRDAPPEAVRTALGHPSARVFVRAAAECLARGMAPGADDEAHLRRRLAAPEGLVLLHDPDSGDTLGLGVDFQSEVVAAAALALHANGRAAIDPFVLRWLQRLAPADGDAAAWVERHLAERAHGALLAALEARMRQLMQVPAEVAPSDP